MKYYQSLFILCLFFLVVSCSGAKDELEQLISRSLRDNQGLSAEECDVIHALINEDKTLTEEFGTANKLAALIEQIAREMSERKSRPIDFPLPVDCFTPVPSEKIAYNVYLENSASMDGYYNGLTEFKDALFDVLTQINGHEEEMSLHFINQDTYPIQKELDEFITYLSPNSLAGLGNRANSKLNDILETVVAKYRVDGKPAILVSDYIFSLAKGANIQGQLPTIKYTIATTCQSLDKEKDAILVIKSQSAFNGIYYDMYNKKYELKGSQRPFYFWVIGPKAMIHSFIEKYGVEKSKGYENYLIIDHSAATEVPYHAILPHMFKVGRFSLCRDQDGGSLCIDNIEFYERGNPPVLKFALAIDLGKIPIQDLAKLEVQQFEVVSEKGDSIAIESIQSISVLAKNDERYRGTATHILVLRTESLFKGEQVVTLKMKKEIPAWVNHTSIIDDTQGKALNKTFGLGYLIEGVNVAFNPNDAFFFEIPVTIRHN